MTDLSAAGLCASELGPVEWVKSSASNPSGNCVELAFLANGDVAMRNSRRPDGPYLRYTSEEMKAFLAGCQLGEFDPHLPA